jgi:hypothetical protein
MVFLVALLYPNGRTHEAVLDRAETPKVGTVFEMYGHTWRVNEINLNNDSGRTRRLHPADQSTRYMCVPVNY